MIHVALTIDSNYVKYCAVVIASVINSGAGEAFTFHVVGNGLSDDDKSAIASVATSLSSGASVRFYGVPDYLLSQYSLLWGRGRLSMTVFYRCMLASLLPSSVERVVYLDCDVIVVRSLRRLWDSPLDGLALAAVPDLLRTPDEYFERLRYDRSFGYFNGGVLLLNLDYWREHGVEDRLSSYFRDHRDRVVRNDQDIMNAVLYKEKKLLDYVWNVQIDVFDRVNHKNREASDRCLRIISEAAIIHFCHRKKPWHFACAHPMRRVYFDAERLTPYDSLAALQSGKVRSRLFFHNILYTLGIKKQKMLTERELGALLADYGNRTGSASR